MRIIISALRHAAVTLNRLSDALGSQRSEWFTNRTGQLSFRPEVRPNGKGLFTATVSCRTGCSSHEWQVRQYGTFGHWRSSRKAMKAARRMARDLAWYRYGFN